MLTQLETGFGLDVVVWLQAHGSSFADLLATLLHLLGFVLFYILAGALLYWRGNREFALRFIFSTIVTALAVDVAKTLIAAPRPYQVAPELVRLLVVQGQSYGLPSGHVAQAVTAFGLLAVWYKGWWRVAALVYPALVAWSRMYAGVHYPQDVVAGALLGGLCLWLALRYYERASGWWMRSPMWVRVLLIVLAAFVLIGIPGR